MPERAEDPLVRSSRREAWQVMAIWCIAMTYTVGYCYLYGYNRPFEELTFVWGFPDWVFWGIVVPWSVCVVVGILFAYFVMTDAEIGDPNEDAGILE